MALEWHVIDFVPDDAKESGPAGADGLCTVTYDPPESGQWWRIEHIHVQNTSTSQTTAKVFVGDTSSQALRDGSTTGNFDNADYSSPLSVPPGQSLIVQWSGASIGAQGTATLSYQIAELGQARDSPPRRLEF